MKSKIFYIGLYVVLILAIFYLVNQNTSLRNSITSKDEIINQMDKSVQDLKFEKGELTKWLSAKDTDFKLKIDSLATTLDVKLKEIHKASQTVVQYHYAAADTVFVPVTYSVEVDSNDKIFRSSFSTEAPCYSIKGLVLSKDSIPQISITDVHFQTEILSITYKKRPAWYKFWKWFSKRKIETIQVSTCGNVESKTVSQE